jgi:hypothetical protein
MRLRLIVTATSSSQHGQLRSEDDAGAFPDHEKRERILPESSPGPGSHKSARDVHGAERSLARPTGPVDLRTTNSVSKVYSAPRWRFSCNIFSKA